MPPIQIDSSDSNPQTISSNTSISDVSVPQQSQQRQAMYCFVDGGNQHQEDNMHGVVDTSMSTPNSTESLLSDVSSSSSRRQNRIRQSQLAARSARMLAEARLAEASMFKEEQRTLQLIDEDLPAFHSPPSSVREYPAAQASTPNKGEYPDSRRVPHDLPPSSINQGSSASSSSNQPPALPKSHAWTPPPRQRASTPVQGEYPEVSSAGVPEINISDIDEVMPDTGIRDDLTLQWLESQMPQ